MAARNEKDIDPHILDQASFLVHHSHKYCVACNDYHIGSFFRRCLTPIETRLFDYERLSKQITAKIQTLQDDDKISVLLLGSTDCTLAQVIRNCVPTERLKDIHLSTIDACETPLKLLQKYSSIHGFHFHPQKGHIEEVIGTGTYDIVIMHGVTGFLTNPDLVLRQIYGLLNVGGHIILSEAINCNGQSDNTNARIEKALRNFEFCSTFLDTTSNLESIKERIRSGLSAENSRHSSFAASKEIDDLVKDAGLQTIFKTELLRKNDPTRRKNSRFFGCYQKPLNNQS